MTDWHPNHIMVGNPGATEMWTARKRITTLLEIKRMTRPEFEAMNGELKSPATSPLQDELQIEQAQRLLTWGKNNFGRYDYEVNNRLDRNEIIAGLDNAGSDEDRDQLSFLHNNYDRLKKQNTGLFGHRDSLSIGDLEKNLEIQQETARKNAEAREAATQLASLRDGSTSLMQPLLATADGNHYQSLFRTLDGIKGGKYDNKVSKGDLERYLSEYDRRARHGDVGTGHFTPATRAYVQDLTDNWDSPAVRRLRGTYMTQRDGKQVEEANWTISADSLREAAGMQKKADLFRPFVAPKSEVVVQPVVEEIVEAAPEVVTRPVKTPTPEEIQAMRQEFETYVNGITEEAAHYRVKPGQGFDRIARDVLRHDTGEQKPPERNVVHYSDEIARMNGWNGRLDTSRMLQKEQVIRVRSTDWVRQQVDFALKQFDVRNAPREQE